MNIYLQVVYLASSVTLQLKCKAFEFQKEEAKKLLYCNTFSVGMFLGIILNLFYVYLILAHIVS